MTRLYYTNPLYAAIMAMEHGVKFDDGDSLKSALEACYSAGSGPTSIPFYVHPDSYGVFEPREGDLAQDERDIVGYYTGGTDYPIKEIIRRADKPFIMPEREE